MRTVLGAILLLVAAAGPEPPLAYRVDEVRSKVVITHSEQDRRAFSGDVAEAGDELRTGWFGHVTLSVLERASRFEVHSSTRVRLAGGEPGVLVVLERGRLKAIFDALRGNDERLVATPGAVLAVRGTRYGVEVDGQGQGVLTVFEGTVEVRPLGGAPHPALLVGVGELCRFGPGIAPNRQAVPKGLTERRWDEDGARQDTRSPAAPGGSDPGRQPGQAKPPGQRPGGSTGKH